MNKKAVTNSPSPGSSWKRTKTSALWFTLVMFPAWMPGPVSGQTPAASRDAPASQPAGGAATPAAVPDTGAAAPTANTTANVPSAIEPFAWLHGCWDGKVNQRDFREEWLPLRGDMMVGVSQTVLSGKTIDFEYLRLESRPDGVFYVAVPSGTKETSFRFSGKTVDDGRDIFTFENPAGEFPKRIIYRRGTEGWLYATVEGNLNGQPRSVMYPMRRVDCISGALIRQ